MAKPAKKKAQTKARTVKKSARVSAKSRTSASRTAAGSRAMKAKAAKPARAPAKKTAAPTIDPLNRKQYGAVTPMLAVSDMRRAIDFYSGALGFTVHGMMDTPQGIVHAELRLRDTKLMLSPESQAQGNPSASSLGNTPVTLYLLVENVDNVFGTAVTAGGKVLMPVTDMFWGDRCGMIGDPDGNKWMIATHTAEPSETEMAEAMRRMQTSQAAPNAV
jgi:PhnB protein